MAIIPKARTQFNPSGVGGGSTQMNRANTNATMAANLGKALGNLGSFVEESAIKSEDLAIKKLAKDRLVSYENEFKPRLEELRRQATASNTPMKATDVQKLHDLWSGNWEKEFENKEFAYNGTETYQAAISPQDSKIQIDNAATIIGQHREVELIEDGKRGERWKSNINNSPDVWNASRGINVAFNMLYSPEAANNSTLTSEQYAARTLSNGVNGATTTFTSATIRGDYANAYNFLGASDEMIKQVLKAEGVDYTEDKYGILFKTEEGATKRLTDKRASNWKKAEGWQEYLKGDLVNKLLGESIRNLKKNEKENTRALSNRVSNVIDKTLQTGAVQPNSPELIRRAFSEMPNERGVELGMSLASANIVAGKQQLIMNNSNTQNAKMVKDIAYALENLSPQNINELGLDPDTQALISQDKAAAQSFKGRVISMLGKMQENKQRLIENLGPASFIKNYMTETASEAPTGYKESYKRYQIAMRSGDTEGVKANFRNMLAKTKKVALDNGILGQVSAIPKEELDFYVRGFGESIANNDPMAVGNLYQQLKQSVANDPMIVDNFLYGLQDEKLFGKNALNPLVSASLQFDMGREGVEALVLAANGKLEASPDILKKIGSNSRFKELYVGLSTRRGREGIHTKQASVARELTALVATQIMENAQVKSSKVSSQGVSGWFKDLGYGLDLFHVNYKDYADDIDDAVNKAVDIVSSQYVTKEGTSALVRDLDNFTKSRGVDTSSRDKQFNEAIFRGKSILDKIDLDSMEVSQKVLAYAGNDKAKLDNQKRLILNNPDNEWIFEGSTAILRNYMTGEEVYSIEGDDFIKLSQPAVDKERVDRAIKQSKGYVRGTIEAAIKPRDNYVTK